MLVRQVDDDEATAADPGHERLGHTEGRVRSNGGVDGIAALAQDPNPRLRRGRIDARYGATRPGRDRLLGRLRRRRGNRGDDQSKQREEG